MIRNRVLKAVLITVVLCLSASAQQSKFESWAPYRSERWQFCAAYPEHWQAEELFEGEVLKASPKGSGGEGAVLTLGAFRNEHGEGEGPAKPLEAIAEDAEDDLRDSMVANVQSHDQSAKVAGLSALITRRSYLNGTEPFLAKEVRVKRDDGVVVELILRAPDEQFDRLQPAFDNMVQQHFSPSCTKVAK